MNIKIEILSDIYGSAWDGIEITEDEHQLHVSFTKLVQGIHSKKSEVNRDTLKRFFHHGGVLAYAVTPENLVVGMATMIFSYKIDGYSARVEHVSILPDYAGYGIGGRLMDAIIAIATRQKVSRLDLTCDPKNIPANRLYSSFGFIVRNNSHQMRLNM